MITTPQLQELSCKSLPIQNEYLKQMNEYIGGTGENGFLSYAVGYTAGAGSVTLYAMGHPVIAAAVVIGGGAYGIATAIDPTINDKIAEIAQSAADAVVSGADGVGDMVSQWWESGSNTSLSFGNGYY